MHTVHLFVEHSRAPTVLARLPSALSVVGDRRGDMTISRGSASVNLSDEGEGLAEFEPHEVTLLRTRFRRPHLIQLDMTGAIDRSRAAEQLARDVLIALVDDDEILVDNDCALLRDLAALPSGRQFVRMLRQNPDWQFRSPLAPPLRDVDQRSRDRHETE